MDKPTIKRLIDHHLAIGDPLPGRRYRHYTGAVYEVLHLAFGADSQAVEVVYRCAESGVVFCRPLSAWRFTAPSLGCGKRYEEITTNE